MVKSRLDLHSELLEFCDNVYFQPPSNINLKYPCIIYNRQRIETLKANNEIYRENKYYELTVIDTDPDSNLPLHIIRQYQMSGIKDAFVRDNLHHSVIQLYYN